VMAGTNVGHLMTNPAILDLRRAGESRRPEWIARVTHICSRGHDSEEKGGMRIRRRASVNVVNHKMPRGAPEKFAFAG